MKNTAIYRTYYFGPINQTQNESLTHISVNSSDIYLNSIVLRGGKFRVNNAI